MKTFLCGAIVALTAYSCFDKPPLSDKPKDPNNAKLKKSASKNLDASIKTGTPVEEPTADGITTTSPTAKIGTQAETKQETRTPVEEPTVDGITTTSPTAKIETQAETEQETASEKETANQRLIPEELQKIQVIANSAKQKKIRGLVITDNRYIKIPQQLLNKLRVKGTKRIVLTRQDILVLKQATRKPLHYQENPRMLAIGAPLKENNTSIPTTSIDINLDNHSKQSDQPINNREKTVQQTITLDYTFKQIDYTFKQKEKTLQEGIQIRKNINEQKEKKLNLEKEISKLKKRPIITGINKEEEEEVIKKLQEELNYTKNRLKRLQLLYEVIERFSIQDIMKYNKAVSNLHYNKYDRTKKYSH
ncbi:hypothetical protein [Candidatus Cardinium hertigii]|uniref:hypothetical protein n=1 Tax=Candidatus Cardinium hertigii TaxID=247481 RepID=UPI003D7D0E22